MSEYGVTPTGFVPKRLDTVIDEIHSRNSLPRKFQFRKNHNGGIAGEYRVYRHY